LCLWRSPRCVRGVRVGWSIPRVGFGSVDFSLALLSTGLLVAAPASAPTALPAGPISSLSVASAVTLKSGVTLTHHYRPVNRVSRAGNRGIVVAGSPAWAEPLERPGQVGASPGRSSQGLAYAASWGAAYVVRRTLGLVSVRPPGKGSCCPRGRVSRPAGGIGASRWRAAPRANRWAGVRVCSACAVVLG